MKVLYAGDAAAMLGPIFVASPFNVEVKGFSMNVQGRPLIEALKADGVDVVHMTNESALVNFPRTVEALSAYDVLIISDCECEILSLYPFWIAGTEVPRTNRLKAIRQYTRKGGGLLIEALPVTCLKVLDDRIETPEGVRVNIKKPDHPVLKGIPWSECPVFEGFNKIIPKEGAEILATIGKCEDENPLILTWKFGKGRSMAFAGDCSPHWAAFFQPWQRYKTFWQQAIRWLGNKK